jgi:hypothetical protein
MSLFLDIILILITILSMASTGVMIWYIRKVLYKMSLLLEERKQIFFEVKKYSQHLNNVHELPLFYGDDTLGRLLAHSKDLVEFLQKSENDILPEEEQDLAEEDEEEDA